MSNMRTFKKISIYIGSRALCYILDLISYFVSLLFSPRRSAIPIIDDPILVTPAIKLSDQIKNGYITSEKVVESFIKRIEKVNPIINAVVNKRFELALQEAREIDKKLADARSGKGDKGVLDCPLIGVPISIKETIGVNGCPITGGLLSRKFLKSENDSDAVNLVRKAKMIPICLTNIPEMAMWWDCSNPVYGRTTNPYDLSRIPGGSSGGEAALISAAGSVVGVGSDIGGSIRMPANFCGIFGHKPSPFIVSNIGMYPVVKGDRERLLGIGPMARYSCDLIPMLLVLTGHAPKKLRLLEPVDISKLRLFYLEDLGDPLTKSCNSDLLTALRNAVGHLTSTFKITSKQVTFDEFKCGIYLWSAEMNKEPNALTMAKQFKEGRNEELNPIVELIKKILQVSEHTMNSITAVAMEKMNPKYNSKLHRILIKKADELRNKFNDLLGEDGILLMPTHPEPAPKYNTTIFKALNISYTMLTTVLQCPITQCPLGFSNDGLPIGVQILARPNNDRLTIAVAQELEKAFGGWNAPCRINV